jgi:transcription antitermination factor NusG
MEPAPCLTVGDRVYVRSGPFAGLEGILLQAKNAYRLVVNITLIQRAVAVEVGSDEVIPARDREVAIAANGSWQ